MKKLKADPVCLARFVAELMEATRTTNERQQAPQGSVVEEWLPFSHTEQRILSQLLSKGARSREEIARALDESVDGRLRGILATLVARRVLMVTTDGYLLNISRDKESALREVLERLSVDDPPCAAKVRTPRAEEMVDELTEEEVSQRIIEARRARSASMNGHS